MLYYALYECRYCKERFRITDKYTQGDQNSMNEAAIKILNNQKFFGSPYLYEAPMILTHNCKDMSVGFADLISLKCKK